MRLVAVFIIFFTVTSAIRGTKYEGYVNLQSQEEIAEFFAIHCEVDSIIGNVTIFNGFDITSLQPMENIKYIEGELTIRHCRQLTSLDGLNENLTITEGVELQQLIVLKNIEPLRNVNTSSFFIVDCRMLGDENSNNINSDVTRIWISDYSGSNLDFLSYYPKLQALTISDCKNLENIDAISGLDDLNYLSLYDNQLVSDCTIDSLCSKMQSGLNVYFTDNDSSCDSLLNIITQCKALDFSCIDTTLSIDSKEMLDFLILEGVQCAENIRRVNVSVQSNDDIISLEGLPLFPNLRRIGIYRTKNLESLSGLNSTSKIRNAYIDGNVDLADFGEGLLFDVENIEVHIENNPRLQSLDGLNEIRSVSTFSLISNNPELVISENIFDDLHAEQSVSFGNISTDISQVLKNVKSCAGLYLDSVIVVSDDISHIEISHSLSIDRIESINSIDFADFSNALNFLNISNCENLLNVENIKLQKSSQGLFFDNSGIVDINFDENHPIEYAFKFEFNKIEIENITLPVADQIYRVYFNNCPNLTSMDFYSNVNEINQLGVYNNINLESFGDQIPTYMEINDLYIWENESLVDISALGNNVDIRDDLYIHDNPKLESCAIDAICHAMNSGRNVQIFDNAEDCERFTLIEICEEADLLPIYNPASLAVYNQSSLDYFAENYAKVDSIENYLFIYIDYADEDRIRDLSFFDSLNFIGQRLTISGKNLSQADSSDTLDLSNFDHCGYVDLQIIDVLFDRLPIIAEKSPIEEITIQGKVINGDFSPFDAIDTLQTLDLRLYNEDELTGFHSLVHVVDCDFNYIDAIIGDFCPSLSSIDELYSNHCSRESLNVFDDVRINDGLLMHQHSTGIRDEDLKFDLQDKCRVSISSADSLNLTFLEGTPALASFNYQTSRPTELNFDFLNNMVLEELHFYDIRGIESINLPELNVRSLSINKCSNLEELHLPTVQNIPQLEIIDCPSFRTISAPLIQSMNVFKLTASNVTSLDFFPNETAIKFIHLEDNSQFVRCEDSLFCFNLNQGNSLMLSGVNGDCNIYDMTSACGIAISKCPTDDIVISTAQNYDTYVEEYSTCNAISYDLTIDKSVVLDSSFLDELSIILGDLTIQEGAGMPKQLDLSNLVYIDGSLNVSGGYFNNTIFDDVEVRGPLSVSNINDEILDATDIFSPSDLSILNCNALAEINLNRDTYSYSDFIVENCSQLQTIEPLNLKGSNVFSMKNLIQYNEVDEFLENSLQARYVYLDNLPFLDTLNLMNQNRVSISLTNNANLSKINGCIGCFTNALNISNCNKIDEIDLGSSSSFTPNEVVIGSNNNLTKITLPATSSNPNWKLENIEIIDNPSLNNITFSEGNFGTKKLIIDNNDLLENLVLGSSAEFNIDDLQIINNENLNEIGLHATSTNPDLKSENVEILNNPSLRDITFTDGNFGTEKLIIDNNELLENFVVDSNVQFVANDLHLMNNNSLRIVNIDTFAIVENFITRENSSLQIISGLGDNEMQLFSLVNNSILSDISNINKNLTTTNLIIGGNAALEVCDYEFICNHISSDKFLIISDNGNDCSSSELVMSQCITDVTNNFFSQLIVYPNPVYDQLTVDDDLIQNVSLININGAIVMEAVIDFHKINVAHLPKGLYYIQIAYKNGTTTQNKIIKL